MGQLAPCCSTNSAESGAGCHTACIGERNEANEFSDRNAADHSSHQQDDDTDPSGASWVPLQDEPGAQGLAGLSPCKPGPEASSAHDVPSASSDSELASPPSASGDVICEVRVASSNVLLVALRAEQRDLTLREIKQFIEREAGPLASDQVLKFGDAALEHLEAQPLKHAPTSGPPATMLMSSALAAAEEERARAAAGQDVEETDGKEVGLEAEASDTLMPLAMPSGSEGDKKSGDGSLAHSHNTENGSKNSKESRRGAEQVRPRNVIQGGSAFRGTMTDKEGAAEGKRAPRAGGAIGKPFPKRPKLSKLSQKTWDKIEVFFRGMDMDGSNAVTRAEADDFFKGAFKKFSTDAMFNEVDVDGSGAIAADEFMGFWEQVRKAGYSDQDICDEVEMLCEGGAWVDWKDDRDTSNAAVRFPKRPLFCKLSAKSWKRCEELFHKFDTDSTLSITREKAYSFFTGAFSNISVEAMFNEVDLNNHGAITASDFMQFWVQVKGSGYKEKAILEEIDMIMEGGAWVDWKDGRSTA